MFKLSEVEACRAQVLLEEALKKLHFLTSIQNSVPSPHTDELSAFTGVEISRIIQEQRDLEKKYDDLIGQRGQLKGLCNKQKYGDTQREIQEVAHKLKESNRSLCRNLKENPDGPGNLFKMMTERAQVQGWLEETRTDLADHSFANLVSKVDAEKRAQERLSEVKRKEREVSANVKQLEAELHREIAENDKETKLANQEIKELKNELQQSKTISDIEFNFEEKKLRAREQALLRIHAQIEKKLGEDLKALEAAERMEQDVHQAANDFLNDKLEKLQKDKEMWTKDYVEKEVQEREAELEKLKNDRANGFAELNELEDKRQTEAMEHKAKEEEMRTAVLVDKQRRQQLQRMAEAVMFLQEEGRKYIQRVQERNAAKKGKKKGKKK